MVVYLFSGYRDNQISQIINEIEKHTKCNKKHIIVVFAINELQYILKFQRSLKRIYLTNV